MDKNTVIQFIVIKANGCPMVSGITFNVDKVTVQDMCDLRDEIDKRMQEMAKKMLDVK